MPVFNLNKINVKATDVLGDIVVLEIPTETSKDKKTGEVTYNVIVVFKDDKKNPVTVKLVEQPMGIEEYDKVELYGLVMDPWAQASGNFASMNWRANATKMTLADKVDKQVKPNAQTTTGNTQTR